MKNGLFITAFVSGSIALGACSQPSARQAQVAVAPAKTTARFSGFDDIARLPLEKITFNQVRSTYGEPVESRTNGDAGTITVWYTDGTTEYRRFSFSFLKSNDLLISKYFEPLSGDPEISPAVAQSKFSGIKFVKKEIPWVSTDAAPTEYLLVDRNGSVELIVQRMRNEVRGIGWSTGVARKIAADLSKRTQQVRAK